MMEKFWSLVCIYYQLQNNSVVLLYSLLYGHVYLDLDLDKV